MSRSWRDREETAFRIVARMARGTRVPIVGTPETLRRLGYLVDVTRYFVAVDDDSGSLEALSGRIRDRVTAQCGDPGEWSRMDAIPSPSGVPGGHDDLAAGWGLARGLDLSRLRSEMSERMDAAAYLP